ncbi:uncharacterized protein LOC6560955 [Drosophila grimshawi]|uniref:GH20694 n=1 Tax=Drosophila grimshawi TaxID=7222 RepID=B4J723_DROGR|nr:uncharacterized protein LOC6560955 [Drosophila grimshawi]EDW01011.1 GH20694 [Drosophila grimshawi]
MFSGFTVLAILCSSLAAAEILECYKCSDGIDSKATMPCSKLQNSPKYRVQCANSTMCEKKVISIILKNGTKWSTHHRDCAKQVAITYKLINRIYTHVYSIEEPYKDGCTESNSHNMLSAAVEHCHCRGNLCNSAPYRDLNILIIITYVLTLLSNLQLLIEI